MLISSCSSDKKVLIWFAHLKKMCSSDLLIWKKSAHLVCSSEKKVLIWFAHLKKKGSSGLLIWKKGAHLVCSSEVKNYDHLHSCTCPVYCVAGKIAILPLPLIQYLNKKFWSRFRISGLATMKNFHPLPPPPPRRAAPNMTCMIFLQHKRIMPMLWYIQCSRLADLKISAHLIKIVNYACSSRKQVLV